MRNHFAKLRAFNQQFVTLCHCAAAALGLSDGEFWIWYGNPFILQYNSHKQ